MKTDVDMTKGGISRHLIGFTIPLILGNIFQLTYNAADSIIVGHFGGRDALAAVGSADPVMNLLILGITGLGIGASVLMSYFYGAGEHEKLKKELGTSLFVMGFVSAAIFILGLLLSEHILRLMNVPDEIFADALKYLLIIFFGMPFTCIYNIYAAALRSVGNSKTPIKFLAFSSILNCFLDAIFVAVFGLGVVGAGLATVIAESVSAVLCAFYVHGRVPVLSLNRSHLKPDLGLMKKTLSYGGTTALQQCSQPVGKLFIQGMVNTLGVGTIAAFNAVGKLEDFALVPERSIGNSIMTFTAQNDGAGRRDRVRKGFKRGLTLELLYFCFICLTVILLNKKALSLFSSDAETLREGGRYFTVMAFLYWLPAVTNGIQGFFRGMKHMKITLAGTITQISFRVLFTYILIGNLGITGIAFACGIGWSVMLVLQVVYISVKKRELIV